MLDSQQRKVQNRHAKYCINILFQSVQNFVYEHPFHFDSNLTSCFLFQRSREITTEFNFRGFVPFSSSLANFSQLSTTASGFTSAETGHFFNADLLLFALPPAHSEPSPGCGAGTVSASVSMAMGSGVSDVGDVTVDVSEK